MAIDITTRKFPDTRAVDPIGCGCTECLIGEYTPEERWLVSALPGDLYALLTGEIINNSYSSLYDLTVGNSWNYADSDTKHLLQTIREEMESEEILRNTLENVVEKDF